MKMLKMERELANKDQEIGRKNQLIESLRHSNLVIGSTLQRQLTQGLQVRRVARKRSRVVQNQRGCGEGKTVRRSHVDPA